MDRMVSLQGHDLKPKVSRRLRRVKSNVPRISGLSSLAGSVHLERSSHSVKDLRPKSSWSSSHGSRRDDGMVIEPDEYFVAMLKNWQKNNPDNVYLDRDGIPTYHHVDNGAAFSQECVMKVEDELHAAQIKLNKAKQKVKHFGRLHIQALKSKDFGGPPVCAPDDMFEAYDRDVDAIACGPPLPIATLHQWSVMAEVELRLDKWQRDVDEAEESVANLNAKMLSFALDMKPAACEKEMDCMCGCQGDGGISTTGADLHAQDESDSERQLDYRMNGVITSRSGKSRSGSPSGYPTRYKW